MSVKNILLLPTAIAAAAVLNFATPAFAGVTFDTGLTNPPGTYFGTGNSNIHWTVDKENGVELGLQAGIRFVTSVTPNAGTATYFVPLGNTTVAGKTGSAWGFAFSYNSLDGTNPLSGITTSLSVLDVLTGQTVTIDPRGIPDNSKQGTPPTAFQNSEALSFTNGVPDLFDPAYNSSLNDTYVITFSASTTGGTLLGSVSETINAGTGVPEPASLAMFGAGLVGLRLVRRKGRSAS